MVVGGRGHRGAVPVGRAVRHRPGRADGEDGEPAAAQRRPHLGAGSPVIDVLERGGVPVEQERRVVVVHRERAAGGQPRLGRCQRLLGEQVALQPQGGLPRERGQRIGQREHDEVVLLVRVLQVLAAVRDVQGEPGVLVGTVRVGPADLRQHRVDLDRVDVLGAFGQRDRRVVPGPRADDQDVVQRGARDVAVRVEVERLLRAHRRQRTRRLVGDVVRRHVERRGLPGGLDVGQLVVRRPPLLRQRDDDGHGTELPPSDARHQQDHQAAACDDSPAGGWQVEESQAREHRDPGDAADDVEPVGAQWPEADEEARHRLAEPGHHPRGEQEDDAKADRLWQRRSAAEPLERARWGEVDAARSVPDPDGARPSAAVWRQAPPASLVQMP